MVNNNLFRDKVKKFSGKIPVFIDNEFYWNQIPKSKMTNLLSEAKNKGWKRALKKYLLPFTNRYTYNYAIRESRGDWHLMMPVNADSKVLDLGCGWGASAMALAKNYSYVCAADSTIETLKFLKIRAEQEGVQNMDFAVVRPLDYGDLPFKKDSFDMVVLNGVLEWTGTEDKASKPRDIQIRALKEIKRILKPDGVLYIGIENRFAATYFFGTKDHSGVLFTSLFPRFIANIIMRIFKKSSYRTYTYSYWGYQKLLKEAGFNNFKTYFPLPTYREPYSIVDVDDRKSLTMLGKYLTSHIRKLMLRILTMLRLEKIFIHSFSIAASEKKLSRFNGIFESLFEKHREKIGITDKKLRLVKVRSKIDNDAAVTFLVYENKNYFPSFFLKLGRNPNAKVLIEKEYRNLQKVQKLLEGHLKESIVAHLFYEENNGILVFKAASGKKMSTVLNKFNYRRYLKPAVDWLIEFQKQTRVKTLSEERLSSYITTQVERFEKIPEDIISQRLRDKIKESLRKVRDDINIFTCAMHGDFNPYNLFEKDSKIEIIDWEDFNTEELYIYDLFHFFSVTNNIILNRKFTFSDELFLYYIKKMNMQLDQVKSLYSLYILWLVNNEYYSKGRGSFENIMIILERFESMTI